MSEYLLIQPDLLYRVYSYKDIEDNYYHFSFLPKYNSIEVDIFYDILNTISQKQLQNMDHYIYKQWLLTKFMLKKESDNNRCNQLCSINYETDKSVSKDLINNKLQLFIKEDPIVGIYIMNKILQFLYPC